MKSDRERMGQFHQGLRTLNIDTSIRLQQPQHKAIHGELFGGQNLVTHQFQFMIGVAEITCPGSDQNMDGNPHQASSRLHESWAGGDSSGR